MKRIILPSLLSVALSITATFSASAQTGPGGVGNSTNNILWLDATQLNLNNGDPVNNWPDVSGNNNDALQTNLTNQALFDTSFGSKGLKFDGTNDYLNLTNNIIDSGLTAFIVTKRNSQLNVQTSLLSISKHYFYSQGSTVRALYANLKNHRIAFPDTTLSIMGVETGPNETADNLSIHTELTSRSFVRGPFFNNSHSTVGALRRQTGSYSKFFNGIISEIILYNERLFTAKRNIVSEYLAAKHNINSFENLYNYSSTHSVDLIGIGQESDGNQTMTSDSSRIKIEARQPMNDGEYLFVAHNDSAFTSTSDVPTGFSARWKQSWRVGEVGEVGSIKLTITAASDLVSGSGTHVLLIDNDGDFSNGGSRFYEITGSSIIPDIAFEFDNINLNDGEVFTLAKKSDSIVSVNSGNWNDPATWSCECIPTINDRLTVSSGQIVTINQNSYVYDLNINGTLSFGSSDTLFVSNKLIINDSLNASSGTIAAINPSVNQFFNNSSSSVVLLNNLYVNNGDGLEITNGNWSLKGSLRVSSGGMNVSGANSFTLLSNASTTAEILPSMEDAFTGEFTIQRYISNRRANYSNHGAPISDATVADLDDENDIIISGVNGNDGNILFPDNSIFYSMFFFDAPNFQHQAITSTSTALPAGKGFELYLLSTPSYFSGATIDYNGTPTSGEVNNRIYWKWNLIGNPYQSHIAYDSITTANGIPDLYQVFNSTTGTYDLYEGVGKPLIAPGQGFWMHNPSSNVNGSPIQINESGKVSSTSSTFKRRKYNDPYFSLNITNELNPFSHKMRLAFDAFATEEMNESDVTLIPSPIKEAPAIYSKAVNSDEELIVNSLNPTEESQLVPVSIYAGVEGKYEINADNIDALYENYSCVYLKDKETEEAIDLMVEPRYSFEAKQGKSDRFHLILSNSYEECQEMIENGSFTQKLDTKVSLRNAYDNWYLDYTLGEAQTQLEIRVYNMSGQEVKAPMSFEANGAGTYPLQHLNDLEGIYLIQVIGKDVFLNKQVKL